jgi:hypothetical protein
MPQNASNKSPKQAQNSDKKSEIQLISRTHSLRPSEERWPRGKAPPARAENHPATLAYDTKKKKKKKKKHKSRKSNTDTLAKNETKWESRLHFTYERIDTGD